MFSLLGLFPGMLLCNGENRRCWVWGDQTGNCNFLLCLVPQRNLVLNQYLVLRLVWFLNQLSSGFHVSLPERFCSHVISIKLELVKSITCDYLKLIQALIALERDELEKEKDFCYANVIKCLRLRWHDFENDEIYFSRAKFQLMLHNPKEASADLQKVLKWCPKDFEGVGIYADFFCDQYNLNDMNNLNDIYAINNISRPLHPGGHLPPTWPVWEKPSCLAPFEKDQAKKQHGELGHSLVPQPNCCCYFFQVRWGPCLFEA